VSSRELTHTVPPGRLLVVSPHLDDAALSCAALLERAEPVDVLTVCAGRPEPSRTGAWDRWTGFRDSDASMAARLKEEMTAFHGSPHRVWHLELWEDQYIDASRPARDTDALIQALREWADAGRGTVAIPAGAGRRHRWRWDRLDRAITSIRGPLQHPDHIFVRDVALETLAERRDVRMLLFEELPYLWGGTPDRAVAGIGRSLGLPVTPIELRVDRAAKASRIAAYASQVPYLFANKGRLDDEHTLRDTERYWWLGT